MSIVPPSGGLEKAVLQVNLPSPTDALDQPGALMFEIKFQFNPREVTMSKSASWRHDTTKNAKSSGPPHYKGPEPSKMSLEMFFDASRTQDTSVKDRVDQLFECCVPTEDSIAKNKSSAPWVTFSWGTIKGFHGYIKSVQAKYTLFTQDGLPIRAVCTVALEEIAGPPPKQNPTSGGLLPRRVHTLSDGDTLAALAYAEYGDPGLWREVAEVNGVDDPMRLRTGTPVFLPTAQELSRPERRAIAGAEVSRHVR